jgi:hypothetical protein
MGDLADAYLKIDELHAQVEIIHDRQEELLAQVEQLRAGADDTPAEEGVMLTPGQWIHMFLRQDTETRLRIVETIFADLEVAKTCRFAHTTGD